MLPGDAAALSTLYGYPGPYVSVYLDATADPAGGTAEDALDERWSVLRDSLAEADADEDTLDAVEESLTTETADGTARGVAVIAARGEVCLAAGLPVRPATSNAGVAALPDVIPYLQLRVPEIANLVVRVEPGLARLEQLVGGRLGALGDWQPIADADGIAAVVRSAARHAARRDPRAVVAVGDSRSIAMIVERLERALVTGISVRVVAPDGPPTAVLDEVVQALVEYQRLDERAVLDSVRGALGHRGAVATGLRDVAAALRNAQADVVVLNDAVLDKPCWVGLRPTEFGIRDLEARAAGVRDVDHASFGSAAIRAALATRATVVLADAADFPAPQGVVARLR